MDDAIKEAIQDMTTVREIIKRDIGMKVEGVVKVFDRSALANEVREYVVTDKIEDEIKRIVDTFTQVSETIRRGGASRDVVGIWVSGFFGSGKSHFAKVLGYLLQNDELGSDGERCIDAFVKHLSDNQRGKDVRLRLGEIKLNTSVRTIAFEIKSRQSLTNPNSVGEILISEFYREIGFGENFIVARIERRLQQRGLLEKLAETFEDLHGVPWRSSGGRDDLMTVRRRLSKVLPKIDPKEYPDEQSALQALVDMFRHEKITAEGIADELVAWVDAQKPPGGKTQHLVFVIDEMGTFIGDSNEHIGELNSLVEMIGNKGKGKVWLVVTSQQDLEKVVDRTNFQPTLVGRLNARFELKPHLISDEINKVVSERILKKRPAEEGLLKSLYAKHEGHIANLADIKASRRLASITERSFIDAYPFLPHEVRLAQDIFEALSGFRISGGVRSMIAVVMEALQDLADKPLGVVVSFDQVFDAVENDLLSQEYLGASGVRSIYESDERVPNMPVDSSRVLKVLWLLQRITWVPRVPETLAKLLVRDLTTEVAPLRAQVEQTLAALQEAGYVARDEATGEWKFLNERERTIEQAIQEMVRPGGVKSISIAAVRRTAQQLCKDEVVTRRKLANFAVTHGTTKIPFSFGVRLDGEAVETGPELEIVFTSPLAPARKQEVEEVRRQNQAAGAKGKTVWWVAEAPDNLEARFKRYEALVKVTSDKRFTEDSSVDTQDALSEKRKERDELKSALVKDLERAFLIGTLFHGGQEIDLEGVSDLKDPIKSALSSVIPNVYQRFSIADRQFDFAKSLKALVNPATSELHKVAGDLSLFDTQGSLQREAALVTQVLEVLADLRDEDADADGSRLLDAKDEKGFKGFSRAPFGWPDELVRVLLAACFRAGAVYIEQQSAVGPTALYDYKGTDEIFSKITLFKKAIFRIAETSLSVDQIKRASKALIAMGVSGTPESGNAIAAAVRSLGSTLKSRVDDARIRAQQGLPIPGAILAGEAALTEPMTTKDPTAVVTAFLAKEDVWKVLFLSTEALRHFLDASRHKDFELSRRLISLAENHPLPDGHPNRAAFEPAEKDIAAIVAENAVVARWSDYRSAFDAAFVAYRDAFIQRYDEVRQAAEAALTAVQGSEAFNIAPVDQREAVVAKVFGPGRACHYPPLALSSVQSLLDAAGKRSLTTLEQALVALPAYRSQVESELAALGLPPPPLDEKVFEWRHSSVLVGKRFATEADVDSAFDALSSEIKARVREGFTVVVK
jgi:hypothetical protein